MGKDKQRRNKAEPINSSAGINADPGPLPSYPYGGKSLEVPLTAPFERVPMAELPQRLGYKEGDALPPTLPTESKSNEGIEAGEVPWCDGPAEYIAANPPQAAEPDATPNANTETQGDTLPTVAVAVEVDDGPTPSLTRDRRPAYTVKIRLEREGRWPTIEPIRDDMMRAARKQGLDKAAAQAWTYTELDRLYPPLPPKAEPPPKDSPVETAFPAPDSPDSVPVSGLYAIPSEWPVLPDNASLQVELGWVQANRLRCVEERGNSTIVRLERAGSPAPSTAALGWLETSIRSYAKYVEVAAKTLAGAADEAEHVRRERMRLDDIRALLDEMHRDAV